MISIPAPRLIKGLWWWKRSITSTCRWLRPTSSGTRRGHSKSLGQRFYIAFLCLHGPKDNFKHCPVQGDDARSLHRGQGGSGGCTYYSDRLVHSRQISTRWLLQHKLHSSDRRRSAREPPLHEVQVAGTHRIRHKGYCRYSKAAFSSRNRELQNKFSS